MRSFIHQGGMLGGEWFREWLAWFLPEKQAISVFLWKAVYVNTLEKSGGDCASFLPNALIWPVKFWSHTSIGPSWHPSPGSPEEMVSIMESVRNARALLFIEIEKGRTMHVLWGERSKLDPTCLDYYYAGGQSLLLPFIKHWPSTGLRAKPRLSFEFLFSFFPHWLIMDIFPFGRYNGVCSLECHSLWIAYWNLTGFGKY